MPLDRPMTGDIGTAARYHRRKAFDFSRRVPTHPIDPTTMPIPAATKPAIKMVAVRLVLLFVAIGFPALPPVRAVEEADLAGEEYFENEIRPILAEHCGQCHGVEKQFGGLRLDSWQSISADSDSAPVVIPGDAENSLLIQAVRREGGLEMPPESELSPEQIERLVHWVDRGAPWPTSAVIPESEAAELARKHWAFQPITRPQPPAVQDPTWPRGPIDSFVLAELESRQLSPSPQADIATLVRRASYVLTGLPPTREQFDRFVRSADPNAYETLIEELLDSPHYGEQWARHWLDVARYSDSKGYVYAREERFWTHAWTYRDWVVRSFNDDRPINEFLLMQLAADQVAQSPDDLAAMGYLTLGRRFLGVKHDIIDDRIDVVCRGMMGLTVGCARCHDHKFDPIPIKDYYSLYGVFDSSAERERSITDPAELDEAYLTELQKREKTLADRIAEVRLESSERVRNRAGDYLAAQFELEKYPDDTFNQVFQTSDLIPTIVRRWQDFLNDARLRDDPVWSVWNRLAPLSELPPDEFAKRAEMICSEVIAGDAATINPIVAEAFRSPPESPAQMAATYGKVLSEVRTQVVSQLGESPLTDAAGMTLPDPAAESIKRVLYGSESPCEIPAEPIVDIEMFLDLSSIEQLWRLQGEVDRWVIQSGTRDHRARSLVDRPVPREPRVFKRGNPLRKDEVVPRQFLIALSGETRQPFAHGSGRLELAQEIIDPANPLTARVFVNRVWGHCFGNPLVNSPSDFGLRAPPPSHPELLDWLAARLIDEGWSMKDLHRQILLSAAFRQSDSGPEDPAKLARAQETDPGNASLWRWYPRRLSLEEMRDSLLAATNELDRTVGGKPVELWNRPYPKRRTLYGVVDRQFLPGLLRVFDFANPDLHIPQRAETTAPQQALFFLNHPLVLEQARTLAGQGETVETPQERINQLFRSVLMREPNQTELADAIAFVSESETPTEPTHTATANNWSYGYGRVTEEGTVADFTPLPHFDGNAWQGGPQFPDASLGWVQLTATGGHPGNDLNHAAIRRWTAQRDGQIAIGSTFTHEPPQGDGVRAFIIHSAAETGILKQAKLHQQTAELNVETFRVSAGDTVDFVVDIGDTLSYDQYLWQVKLIAQAEILAGGEAGRETVWDSVVDFAGTEPERLNAWEQLAQVLLGTNEFLFVP
jgi:mono/diheme cytochrome c family protein